MKIKRYPKRNMNPTIKFDSIQATFDDLIKDMVPKIKEKTLFQGLRLYHQTFQSLFFNQDLSGSILLTLWDEDVLGFDVFNKAKQCCIFKNSDLTLHDLESVLIVYEPPLYCFTTPNPFKYLNKRQLDLKLHLFQKGLEILFNLTLQPILYPF